MRYRVTVRCEGDEWVAHADSTGCEGRGRSKSEAVERVRAAIVFDLEICPCDVTADSGVVLEVHEEPPGAPGQPRRIS